MCCKILSLWYSPFEHVVKNFRTCGTHLYTVPGETHPEITTVTAAQATLKNVPKRLLTRLKRCPFLLE